MSVCKVSHKYVKPEGSVFEMDWLRQVESATALTIPGSPGRGRNRCADSKLTTPTNLDW